MNPEHAKFFKKLRELVKEHQVKLKTDGEDLVFSFGRVKYFSTYFNWESRWLERRASYPFDEEQPIGGEG